MNSLFLATALVAFPAERDVAPIVSGPNPGSTRLTHLLPLTGGGFYAIYNDARYKSSMAGRVGMRGARITSTLDLTDTTGVPLPVTFDTFHLRAAHDGSGLEIAYSDFLSGQPRLVRTVRAAEDGRVLRGDGVLWTAAVPIEGLGLAHDGSRGIVAWIENASPSSTLRVATITAAGVVTGPWTVATDAGYALGGLTVSSSAGTALVAWTTYHSPTSTTLDAVKLPPGQPPTTPVVLATRGALGAPMAVATLSGAWYLAWYESAAGTVTVQGASLPANGPLGSTSTLDSVTSMYAIAPRLAFDGTDVRAVWSTYLDVRARTVPLSGTPTAGVQTLRSGLPFDPGAGVACSGTCVASWSDSTAGMGGAIGGNAFITRLGPNSTAVDVPYKEISFPADEQTTPILDFDGQAHVVLFTRRVGRGTRELVARRLSSLGSWVDAAPLLLAPSRSVAATARVPDGGLLVAEMSAGSFVDYRVYGQRLEQTGSVVDAGVWANPFTAASSVHLACATSLCGLLHEQSNSYAGTVVSHQGAVLTPSNVYVAALSLAKNVALHAVEDTLAVLFSKDGTPPRAAVASASAFPMFAAPFDIAPNVNSAAIRAVASGNQLAVVFVERDTCRVLGRRLDLAAGAPMGSVVTVRDCGQPATVSTAVIGITAKPGGYSVLFVDQSSLTNGFQYDYSVQDADSALNPVGAARLVDRRDAYLYGLAFARVAGREVFGYARFDEAPGVLSTRAKLAGLESDGGVGVDAGPAVDAGGVDAGTVTDSGVAVDAGTAVDGGGVDAGAMNDAGVAVDAGPAADAGGVDAGTMTDAGPAVDAGGVDAGAMNDAGVAVDAGPAVDAGSAGSELGTAHGCGCSQGNSAHLLALGFLLMLRRICPKAQARPPGQGAPS